MVEGRWPKSQILHDSETSREGSSPAHLVLPDYCLGDGQREVHLHPLHLRPTLLQTLLYLLQHGTGIEQKFFGHFGEQLIDFWPLFVLFSLL